MNQPVLEVNTYRWREARENFCDFVIMITSGFTPNWNWGKVLSQRIKIAMQNQIKCEL